MMEEKARAMPLRSLGEESPRLALLGHHHHHHHHLWSRRGFLHLSGTLVGAAVSFAAFGSTAHAAQERGVPSQVPGFSPVLEPTFGEIPFFLPIEVDPFVDSGLLLADPLTINNFDGVFGLVEADGVSGHNSDGVDRRWACDIRVMTGVFADREGRQQRGSFAFF